jgi:NAD(P)-dependent dehydrogenase (short-subunit alcohol dehydrogenase family)
VIGGSTGIGNAVAQQFSTCGAEVHVKGTRASAQDYTAEDVSDLAGLGYSQLDLSERQSLARWHTGLVDGLYRGWHSRECHCAGLAKTKMGRRGHPKYDELVAKTERRLPMRRTGTPEEMAGPILFLCSSLASYMIGQTLIVDGGMSLTS